MLLKENSRRRRFAQATNLLKNGVMLLKGTYWKLSDVQSDAVSRSSAWNPNPNLPSVRVSGSH